MTKRLSEVGSISTSIGPRLEKKSVDVTASYKRNVERQRAISQARKKSEKSNQTDSETK